MKTNLVGIAALALALVVLVTAGCYECADKNCSNIPDIHTDYPPGPRFGAELERACGDACAHLRALGCPEGSGSMGGEPCTVTCTKASSARPLPLACWSDAGSTAEAKACGALRCIR
jgi:hypothetical protein